MGHVLLHHGLGPEEADDAIEQKRVVDGDGQATTGLSRDSGVQESFGLVDNESGSRSRNHEVTL